MSGIKNGVVKRISDKEPRVVFTHCYGHALNLAVGDTVKSSKICPWKQCMKLQN